MFSPPEKKEPTASKNLPILASMAIADLRYGQFVPFSLGGDLIEQCGLFFFF